MDNERLKIALFITTLDGGGAERVMVNLACGFTEHGFKVDLILLRAMGPYLAELQHHNIRIVDLDGKWALACLPSLVRYLRQEKPLILLSALNHANILAILAVRVAKVPTRLVISQHEALSRAATSPSFMKSQVMPLLARWCFPWADAVVAVSQGVSDDLVNFIGLCPKKIYVIQNPIVGPALFHQAQASLNHPWFIPGEPPVILSVGRLAKPKDFTTLIKAFAKIHKERPVRLMILGEGEDRYLLEMLVKKLGLEGEILLPGFVDNPYAYMAKASVFVLSSAWEGFGNVLIEAMAVGTPVISTNCESGPSEILENGKWGKLVAVGDVDAMAGAIVASLETEPDRNALKGRAAYFTIEKSVVEYLNVLGLDNRSEVAGCRVIKEV